MSDAEDAEIQDTAAELFPPNSEKDPPREGWGENQSEVERRARDHRKPFAPQEG